MKRAVHRFEGFADIDDNENIHDEGVGLRLSTWPSREIARILLSRDWLRFAFVRNPYQRIFSAWISKIVGQDDAYYAGLRATLRTTYGYSSVDGIPRPTVSFRDFVEFVLESQDPDVVHDGHWDLQRNVLLYDVIPYDTIGRFERFGEDFAEILRRLRAPDHELQVAGEVTNASPSTPPLLGVYDTALADVIYCKYEPDFETFGYDRASWRSGD